MYSDDAPVYIKLVNDGVHELFLEHVALPLPLTSTYAEEGNGDNNMKTEDQHGNFLAGNEMSDFDIFIKKMTSQ